MASSTRKQHTRGLFDEEADEMPVARRRLDPPDELDVAHPLPLHQVLHPLGAFQMVVVGDGDHLEVALAGDLKHTLRTGCAIAEVRVQMQIGPRQRLGLLIRSIMCHMRALLSRSLSVGFPAIDLYPHGSP